MVIKKKILGVLAEMAANQNPDLVASTTIAERLNISLAETRSTMMSMCEAGVIESDPETERALITRQGMHWLNLGAEQKYYRM
jgi:DNA-binding IclR family transcriptional regulator